MYHEPGFLVSLDADQRVRYYDWWQRYLLWRRIAIIVAVIWLGAAATYSLLLPAFFPGQVWLHRIAGFLNKPLFVVALGIGFSGSLMDCPRCGQSFRGWFRRGYFGNECQNWGLSYRELSSIGNPHPNAHPR
jgi:hypothetical protein